MSDRFTIKTSSRGKHSIVDNADIAFGVRHEEYNLTQLFQVERLCDLLNQLDYRARRQIDDVSLEINFNDDWDE